MLDSSAWFRSSKRIPTHLLFQNYYLGFIGLKKFAQTMKPAAELVERTKWDGQLISYMAYVRRISLPNEREVY